MKPKYQDPDALKKDQYKNASNLTARANLHKLYTISESDWQPWVFDQIAPQPNERILDCGGGPGWLWRENLDRLPKNINITFTDLSDGMVAEAQANLGTDGRFTCQTANIMELPFDNNSFDAVVANHMLYHVPDRPKALSEVKRVLKPNGRFLAATNGVNHLKELFELGRDLLPLSWFHSTVPEKAPVAQGFKLEDGRSQLEPYFNHIEKRIYHSHLAVTDAPPLIDYILSSSEARQALTAERRQEVTDHVSQIIAEKGHFYISKDTGIFIATG